MIYDGKKYGVFSDEMNIVIELVRSHEPLQIVEGHLCPKCDSQVRVGFYPDGKGFIIRCEGEVPHMTQYQALDTPPAWWKERVVEVTSHLQQESGD